MFKQLVSISTAEISIRRPNLYKVASSSTQVGIGTDEMAQKGRGGGEKIDWKQLNFEWKDKRFWVDKEGLGVGGVD
jgi:hypothetical protein